MPESQLGGREDQLAAMKMLQVEHEQPDWTPQPEILPRGESGAARPR